MFFVAGKQQESILNFSLDSLIASSRIIKKMENQKNVKPIE